jgi:hypothetical protein
VRRGARRAAPVRQEDRRSRGCTLFQAQALARFLARARGDWPISGVRTAQVQRLVPHGSGPQVSRLRNRLHVPGRIRKVGHPYKE